MDMDWERVLHEWMRRHNELEIRHAPAGLETGELAESLGVHIQDETYVALLQKRLRALAESDRARGIKRRKNEMRLKILDVKRHPDGVNVFFRVKRKMFYRQDYRDDVEERMEHWRCKLAFRDNRWIIEEVRHDEDEKVARNHAAQSLVHGGTVASPAAQDERLRPPAVSAPYLHPSIRLASTSPQRDIRYDREAVRHYADTWWDYPNPEYEYFQVDCTNFVSQCLYAGGVPMDYTKKREKGWWYRHNSGQNAWSFSWSVAHSLHWYLSDPRSVFRAERVSSPQFLDIGDVICYDWDGSGRYGHTTIVTAKDAEGMPLVNAHTSNSKRRYWDYRDSSAWTDKIRYRFFHITDWL